MPNRVSQLGSKLKNSLYVRQVANLVSGTSLAHLITIALSPVLTRIFPAEAFGELQLFHSIVIILSIVSTGCFEYTFVLPQKDRDASLLFKFSFLLNLLFNLFLYLFIYFANSVSSLPTDLSSLFVWLIPLGVFFNSALNIITHFVIRFEQYGTASKSKVLQSSVTGGTQTGLGIAGILNGGLIIGHIAGRIISTVFLFFSKTSVHLEKVFYKQNLRPVTKKYFDTTKFLLPSNILSYGAIEIPVFIIGALFDQEMLGFYALAYRVLSVPSAFIGNSVGQVFYKQLSDRYNNGVTIRNFLVKTWGTLFLITIIPTGILLLWSESLFAFVFGEQWQTAGSIAMIMAPLLAIDFISAPTGKTLIVLEKQKIMPVFSFLNLITRAGGLLIGWHQQDFLLGIILMVIGHILSLITYNLYLLKAVGIYETAISANDPSS